jgi:hypothetical protein
MFTSKNLQVSITVLATGFSTDYYSEDENASEISSTIESQNTEGVSGLIKKIGLFVDNSKQKINNNARAMRSSERKGILSRIYESLFRP